MEFLKKARAPFKARALAPVLFCCILLLQAAQALAIQMDEQKIKAGLVYNLLKYTEWPADSYNIKNQRLEVCIYGDDPFQGALDPMQGRTAQQYKIRITRIHDVSGLYFCNLVFIPRAEQVNLRSLLKVIENKSILTVSDIPDFSRKGGMVELAMREQRIRLYIDQKRIGAARLTMQARLLRLAEGGPPR